MIHLQYQMKQMTNMERRTEEQLKEVIYGGKTKQKKFTWIPVIREMKKRDATCRDITKRFDILSTAAYRSLNFNFFFLLFYIVAYI